MGMVVRSNVMAINAFRQLGMNNSQVSKSLEKLSSGFRINRAGDDASGLAISEKMKAQIKGLETASSNCQDGISLIQTAEGALTEVHDMLNRMVELCGKAANGTMDSVVDRPALQQEVEQLKDEINRIAKGTNFNGTFLLNGDLTGNVGGAGGITTDLATTAVEAKPGKYDATIAAFGTALAANGDKVSFTVALDNGKSLTYEYTATDFANKKFVDQNGNEVTLASTDNKGFATQLASDLTKDLKGQFKVTADANGKLSFEAVEAGTKAPVVKSLSTTTTVSGTTAAPAAATMAITQAASDETTEIAASAITAYDGTNLEDAMFTINGKKFVVAADTVDASKLDKDINVITSGTVGDAKTAQQISQVLGMDVKFDTNKFVFAGSANSSTGNGLVLQIGDTAEDYNEMTVSIQNMDAASLGIDGVDISTREGGSAALAMLRNAEGGGAINTVSTVRARLGALQNRLEHTINNLDVAAENMTSANSRIRDTDMAKQMMEYTKMNVLTQAAQAMLAQANQQPQSVLQLLQ